MPGPVLVLGDSEPRGVTAGIARQHFAVGGDGFAVPAHPAEHARTLQRHVQVGGVLAPELVVGGQRFLQAPGVGERERPDAPRFAVGGLFGDPEIELADRALRVVGPQAFGREILAHVARQLGMAGEQALVARDRLAMVARLAVDGRLEPQEIGVAGMGIQRLVQHGSRAVVCARARQIPRRGPGELDRVDRGRSGRRRRRRRHGMHPSARRVTGGAAGRGTARCGGMRAGARRGRRPRTTGRAGGRELLTRRRGRRPRGREQHRQRDPRSQAPHRTVLHCVTAPRRRRRSMPAGVAKKVMSDINIQ